MKNQLSILAAAAVMAIGMSAAQAQPSVGSTSGNPGVPAKGEKSTKDQDKGMAANTKTSPTGGGGMSTEARSTVHSDAAMANKSGTGTPKGEKSTKDQDKGGVKQ